MKLTLAEVRNQLYTAVVPNLNTQANIDLFDQTLNFACERLINDGTWLGSFEHVAFLVSPLTYHITLPSEYSSVQAMAFERMGINGCVSRTPVQIKNQWMSLLAGGRYLWDWGTWGTYGFQPFEAFSNDKGDGFVTFKDSPYTEYTLRFELENSLDAGKTVTVKGYDENGDVIFTPASGGAYQGITFTLTNPDTEPAQHFTNQLYFLHKSDFFQGYLKLYAVDVDTAAETLIGTYLPSEINPDYRRYSVPNCNSTTDFTVRTICKRRYVPMIADTDSVIPANFGALRTALTAIVYERQNDPGRRDTEMMAAIELLNKELRSSFGGDVFRLRIDGTAMQFGNLWPGR